MTLTVDQLTAIQQQLKAHGITKEFRISQSKGSLVAILKFIERGKTHIFKYSYDGHTIDHRYA